MSRPGRVSQLRLHSAGPWKTLRDRSRPQFSRSSETRDMQQKKFLVELIKPSHYDDQGYIIQWWRGFVPSNSLSCLYGLALDVRERRALGDDVDIDIEARDETNAFVPVKTIIRRFAENENRGLLLLSSARISR